MEIKRRRSYRFDDFVLDVEDRTLLRDGQPIALSSKAFDVLLVLLEGNGRLVRKETLLSEVWNDAYVEENTVNRSISILRKALGDSKYIETVPKHGYRFIAEVVEEDTDETALVIERHTATRIITEEETTDIPRLTPQGVAATSPWSLRRRRVLIGAVTLSMAAAAAYLLLNGTLLRSKSGLPIKSLAVLPFRTIGAKEETFHRGLGMADILITRLSNIKGLKVRPTSAVAIFRDQGGDSLQFGRKLQVDAVLEGTIYRDQGNLRITARLIRLEDQSTLWTGRFDKPWQNETQVQNEIALEVSDALALNLSNEERSLVAKQLTQNPDAYELYVLGRFHWNKRDNEGILEAQRLFRNAIDRDPSFALAYVGLADTLIFAPTVGEAYYDIQKALELDPNLAEAYATRGFISLFHEWEFDRAEASFKKSIEINGGYPTAHQWYATLLMILGRHPEAEHELRLALEINPVSYNILADLGQAHFYAGDYRKAEEFCLKALEIYPAFMFAHGHLSSIYFQTGEYEKAIDELAISLTRLGTSPYQQLDVEKEAGRIRRPLLEAFQSGGIDGFWRHQLEQINKLRDVEANRFISLARTYVSLGDKQKALDNLELARDRRAFLMPFVGVDPTFERLRAEPRFQEILRSMKLAG